MAMTEMEKLIVRIWARNDGTTDSWWSVYQSLTDIADGMLAVWRDTDNAMVRLAADIALAHSITKIREAA